MNLISKIQNRMEHVKGLYLVHGDMKWADALRALDKVLNRLKNRRAAIENNIREAAEHRQKAELHLQYAIESERAGDKVQADFWFEMAVWNEDFAIGREDWADIMRSQLDRP